MESSFLSSIVLLACQLLGFLVLGLSAIVVHEAGHALAAVCCGFRILSVSVGPVQLRRSATWAPLMKRQPLLNGFVQVQFRKVPGRWAVLQCLAFVVAGPGANILPAFLIVLFMRGESGAANLACLFLVFSAFVGLVQLIPFKTPRGTSDGSMILALLISRRRREDLLFLFSISPRIASIVADCRAGRLQEGLKGFDDLVRRCGELKETQAKAKFAESLAQMRERLHSQLSAAEDAKSDESTRPN